MSRRQADEPEDDPTHWTWAKINEVVMSTEDEVYLATLLDRERCGKRRKMFMLRIKSRINKVRDRRETAELIKESRRG